MKKHFLLGVLLLSSIACEEAIDVTLPAADAQLVIDALIGYNSNSGQPITIGQVALTLTTSFFTEAIPPALNATVRIIDETSGEVFPLEENAPGVFRTGFPDLQFGREYTLEIIYEGETFRATEELVPTGTINSVTQGDGFLFDEDEETEVIVNFSDIPNERNYYLFAFGFDNYLVTDDEFYQNESLTFSYFYEDINPGDLLTITLLGIDRQFASYVDQVLVQSGDSGGAIFGTPPATVRGNITNITDQENFPFGYFALSEFDAVPFTVE